MKKFTEEQELLLSLVPEGFVGTVIERLVYGMFCHCNNVAINRGEKTFTLGYKTLEKETGLCRATLSKVVNDLIHRNIIGRSEIGKNVKGKNTTYYTFCTPEIDMVNRHGSVDMVCPCESDSYTKIDMVGRHGSVDTNYNFNYNNNINTLSLHLPGPEVQENKLNLKENSLSYVEYDKLKERKDECEMNELSLKIEELMNVIKNMENNLNEAFDRIYLLEEELKSTKRRVSFDKTDKNINCESRDKSQCERKRDYKDINAEYGKYLIIVSDKDKDINSREEAYNSLVKMSTDPSISLTDNQRKRIEDAKGWIDQAKKDKSLNGVSSTFKYPDDFLNGSRDVYGKWAAAYMHLDKLVKAEDAKKSHFMAAHDLFDLTEKVDACIARNEIPSIRVEKFNMVAHRPDCQTDFVYSIARELLSIERAYNGECEADINNATPQDAATPLQIPAAVKVSE